MGTWIKALFSETVFSAWWILSAASTLSTFFVHSWAGTPRTVLVISTLIGFAWANFRIFQKQEKRIASAERRASELRITPDNRISRYFLLPAGAGHHADFDSDFNGGYLEFWLMIENVGRRNSTVNNYKVEIAELNRKYPDLRPQEGRNGIPGRLGGNYGVNPNLVLSKTGIVRINAETTTNRGTLLFLIPDLSRKQFVDAGISMEGEQHKFGILNCRLTLTDTAGSSVTQDFQLREA